tara:strand:+ start:183 stop:467 length:285 start_codon:yes stop_codon:yes gene_type:complete
MHVQDGHNCGDYAIRDFLWKLGNYRHDGQWGNNKKLAYITSMQRRIDGELVAPIALVKASGDGYLQSPVNGDREPLNIMMTKEEVNTFNYNFTI